MRRAVRVIVFKDNNLLVMKRNKFGTQYYTLIGGAIGIGETPEHALEREVAEETMLQLGKTRLVFVEDAGEPYGVQFVYLADYIGGEPKLNPSSDEASINQMGKNLYEPMWLPVSELAGANFISPKIQRTLVDALQNGFPDKPVDIS